MIFEFDAETVRDNACHSTTADLLERVTVYRSGMQPEALKIVEDELLNRGVGPMEILAHRNQSEHELLFDNDGLPLTCSLCNAPAVTQEQGWYRIWGMVPLFPRLMRYCQAHRPQETAP
jgi:hypothetical protein